MSETFTFFWDNADLAARDGQLTLDDAAAHNYAIRKQVAAHGNPTGVERVPSTDGKRTLFRLTWETT